MSCADASDLNVGFAHWLASYTVHNKASASPSAGGSGEGEFRAHAFSGGEDVLRVEALEVMFFSEQGHITEIFQFRSPTKFEEREVLAPAGHAEHHHHHHHHHG